MFNPAKRVTRSPAWLLSLAALGAVLATLAAPAPVAFADPASYSGVSADGESVFFTTAERLVPGDTDNRRDVYERFYDSGAGIESYVTREVSTGPAGGNDAYDVSFDAVSEDGTRVVFSTAESLVSEDKDLATDVYVRNLNTGATSLVSGGPGFFPASFDAASGDGSRVVFSTEEPLAAEDHDFAEDVYLRSGSTTSLVSRPAASCLTPGCGDADLPSFFDGASADARTIVFGSAEALSAADFDSADDIYVRDISAGSTSFVSPDGNCPGLGPGECTPIFGAISSDGSHVFYETGEQVAAGQDSDEVQDVYAWSGVAPVLVSTGLGGGNGNGIAIFGGASSDGSVAFFESSEKLAADDLDPTVDTYLRSGSTTSLVSTGPTDGPAGAAANFEQTAASGTTAIFSTTERLTLEDSDDSRDVYSRDVGAEATQLISRSGPGCTGSCGNGAADAGFAGASVDGSRVFFETTEPLVPADSDGSSDVYARDGSDTVLVSTGPTSKNTISSPHLAGLSEDGGHALIATEERLTIDDLDSEADVYDRSAAGTLLVSARNSDELVLGPPPPLLTATNPASPGVSTEPRILGEADADILIKVYANSNCSGATVATGSGAALEGPGIPVTVAAASTTTFHATATFLNDTSNCSAGLTYQQAAQVDPEDAGGGPGTDPGTGPGTGAGSAGGGTVVLGNGHVTPRTRITLGPGSRTRQRRPTFQFVDSTGQSGTDFECAVDRGRWRACSSPMKLKKLAKGRHVFKVRAANSGLQEPVPVIRRFKVVSR
jgi:hypothetical protein